MFLFPLSICRPAGVAHSIMRPLAVKHYLASKAFSCPGAGGVGRQPVRVPRCVPLAAWGVVRHSLSPPGRERLGRDPYDLGYVVPCRALPALVRDIVHMGRGYARRRGAAFG